MTTRKKKTTTRAGDNRTGTATAPRASAQTKQGAQDAREFVPIEFENEHLRVLRQWNEQEGADATVGTMPPPASMKGVAKSVVGTVTGRNVNTLLDKIGERLAFERTGTRLYELLIAKLEVSGSWNGGPGRRDLERIRAQEHEHFRLLVEEMRRLGGDPNAVTPSADLVLVESLGLHKVIADGRTTLAQALHAIQIAELADRDGWALLIELARELGEDDAAERFEVAARQEQEHLANVRRWQLALLRQDATAAVK